METPHLLREIGLNEKEIVVYLTLLSGGPQSVRKLAKEADLNRGTAYDILKALQRRGLVGFHQKHKKQFFAAEDPQKLVDVIEQKERDVASLRRHVTTVLPELRSLYTQGGTKPAVKYYEGTKGINIILRDVLTTMHDVSPRLYRAYSALGIRDSLYREFPDFTKERIKREIDVRVVAIGSGGGEQPYSERRWLPANEGAPTYTIIYGPKVAHFSLDEGESPLGILIEDARVAETERLVFDHVWRSLEHTGPSVPLKTDKERARV